MLLRSFHSSSAACHTKKESETDEKKNKKMGFWELLEVASAPVLQIFIISSLGAFMATDYFNILTEDARKHMNKIVFLVFTPALMFANLAKTVTFQDIISWWFMPVNIGIIFVIGATLGWVVVRILKPEPHIEGLVIATCSAGNLGNLLLIVVPAICNENGSPFGDRLVCKSVGLSYASFSMALGGFFIWSHTYHLLRSSSEAYIALQEAKETFSNKPNCDLDANRETHLLKGADDQDQLSILVPSTNPTDEEEAKSQAIPLSSGMLQSKSATFRDKLMGVLHNIVEEFSAPPTIAAIVGLIFGAIPWLKHFVIGDDAPLRVVEDSIKLLGDGTIPCITLILGGNLYQGLQSGKVRPLIIIGIICVRYIILPVIGLGVVRAADYLGLLPADPLFQYVLMVQFTLPPAMNIGTITQLFNVGQEECSILLLWTYLVAALALTVWSTVFLYILA